MTSSAANEMEREQPLLLASVVFVAILGLLYVRSNSSNKTLALFYESQPCPGRKQQYFSWLRATFRSVFDTPQRVAEGYTKYAKTGEPFLVPNIRKGPILVIPPPHLRSVLSNPEGKLSAHAPQSDLVSAQYTMRDPKIYPSNYEVDVVKKQITKRFGSVTEELAEEMALAFEDYWGTSSEWKAVVAWGSLQEVAARTVNRVIMGLPLCRNKAFLKRSMRYSMSVVADGAMIAMLPSFLKPILGPLVAWRGKRDCEACIDLCLPLVEARLKETEREKAEPHSGRTLPNDMLQWVIEESYATNDPGQITPRRIAHRLVILNFNAVPPTGLTLSNTLLDLYSAPPSEGFVEALREQCNRVFDATPERYWTKDAVSKLSLVDSTIRESMRHSDFGSLAFPRRVATPHGLEMPNGLKVPKGVNMEIPMHAIHMDESFYPRAASFEPFRFAGTTESVTGGSEKAKSQTQKPLITLDDTFLTFGYGRNGCPGRYFGAHLLKTMLAHIVQKYDVEYMPQRPAIVTLMEFRFPSESTTIRVRRRGQGV